MQNNVFMLCVLIVKFLTSLCQVKFSPELLVRNANSSV
jgi:hypothetical protein